MGGNAGLFQGWQKVYYIYLMRIMVTFIWVEFTKQILDFIDFYTLTEMAFVAFIAEYNWP